MGSCCGSGQRKPKNGSSKIAQAAPLPATKDAHAVKLANQVTQQAAVQLANQQKMAKANPNAYLNRFM